MPNVNDFRNDLLVAFGGTANAKNDNDFRTKLIAAVTAMVADAVQGTTIVALGGTITGATGNDTMTAVADIATAGGATPSATQVDTAVNGAIVEIENNFKDLQDKVNELITAIA